MLTHHGIAATLVGTALAAAALGLGTVATASNASAITGSDGKTSSAKADAKFLEALEDEGIVVNDPQGAVELGQAVCADLDRGATPEEELDDLLEATNLTGREGAVVIAAAISAYCPEHQDLLDS